MNKIFKLLGSSLMVAMALTACSPETFDGPDQNGIPSVTGVDIDMNVDQAVNEATFTVQNMPKGTYAFWTVDDKVYSTLSPMHWANSKAGTYAVELRLGNRNGFSQSSITKTFTFENTKVDFTQYISRISRTWRINHTEVGHMGCGEPGTDGSNWWSANREPTVLTGGVHSQRIKLIGVSMMTASLSLRMVCTTMTQVKVVQCMSIMRHRSSQSIILMTVMTLWLLLSVRHQSTTSM